MTQRTKAELDAFFVDNTLGLITPAMLRDFVETMMPTRGAMHFADPGTPTIIGAPLTWTKASNLSTLHDANRMSMPLDNRLRYDGVAAGVRAIVCASLSFSCAANNQVLAFALAVNGVVITESKVRTKIATGADVQAVAVVAHPTLNANDYIEVFVSNETSASNITIEHGHVSVVGFMN